jgi:hypothetical protein
VIKLNQLREAKGKDALSIAAGNFNFACGETTSPAYDRLLPAARGAIAGNHTFLLPAWLKRIL